MGETYLTPREAAAYLRSSHSTLAKRRLQGNGPCFVRLGRAVRYRRSDLDAWMSGSAAPPEGPQMPPDLSEEVAAQSSEPEQEVVHE
jgi:excisionase family DNA binding protein